MVQGVFAMTFDITDEVKVRKALSEQEKRLRDVTDSIPALVGYFDREENCLYGNSRARRMAGLGEGPLDGVTLRSAVGEAVYAQHLPHLPDGARGAGGALPGAGAAPRQGRVLPGQPDPRQGSAGAGAGLLPHDLQHHGAEGSGVAPGRKRVAPAHHHRQPAGADHATSTASRRSPSRTPPTASGWGSIRPRSLGRHIRDVAGPELYLSRKAMLERALAGERVEFEAATKRADFDRITHVIYVPDIGVDGSTHGIFSLSLDITALKQVERQLIELARVDTLTGLPNRLAFNEYLPSAIARARRAGSAIALMFLDIDHFKSINDTLGHAAGDEVLAEYAGRLLSSVRSTDTVARLAGDEFVIVLENPSTQEAAAAVARKIVARINAPAFQIDGQPLDVTTSIGIAFHPGDRLFRHGRGTAGACGRRALWRQGGGAQHVPVLR